MPGARMPASAPSPERGGGVLDRLARRTASDCRDMLLVVAHPDDETIALGARLARLQGIRILHVTDGAPANMADARGCGFGRREDYAAARAAELDAALGLAGISPAQRACLAIRDQEAVFALPDLARRLAADLRAHPAAAILTHAIEGGHPDHDATAFAVRAARHLLARDAAPAPAIVEFPLYHSRAGQRVYQEFAPDPSVPHVALELDAAERAAKRAMLAAFVTQAAVLAPFTATVERLRPAPRHDLAALPNGGELLYESFGWGLTGRVWLAQVEAARHALDLSRWL
jgi:N-acetylglucosamine malate deacetylase 2